MNKKKSLQPRDAATLVLYHKDNNNLKVLMGCRDSKHAFMPNRYVFPGGAVDPADRFVKPARELHSDVWQNLAKSCSRSRARALAAAAIRETWEETGLRVAKASPPPLGIIQNSWKEFHESGLSPDLSALDYVCRAITPPGRTRRFNARFFIAQSLSAKGNLAGSSELSDLKWISIDDALTLPIPDITSYVLKELPGWIKANRPRKEIPLMKRVKRSFVRIIE